MNIHITLECVLRYFAFYFSDPGSEDWRGFSEISAAKLVSNILIYYDEIPWGGFKRWIIASVSLEVFLLTSARSILPNSIYFSGRMSLSIKSY